MLHFSARRDANIDAARWGDLPAVRGLRLELHRAARGTEVVAFLLEERHDLRVAAGCPVQVPRFPWIYHLRFPSSKFP